MAAYAAAYARMHALKGELLSQEELDVLLRIRGLTEAVSYVREHTGIELSDTSSLPRIEHKLKESLLSNYIKIVKFLEGGPAEVVKCLLSKFELSNLKLILYSKLTNKDLSDKVFFYLGPYSTIAVEDLLKAKGIEECLDILRGSIYKELLTLLSKSFKDGKPHLLGLILDLHYYKRLHNALSNLSYSDRRAAETFVGCQIDILNILRFLRLKINYSFSPEEIFPYIFPYGLRFTPPLIWKMATIEDPVLSFPLKPYNKILKACQGNGVVSQAEVLLNRYLFNFARKRLIGSSPFQLTPLLAFFVLNDLEIRDIISILNGKRLGLKEDDIKRKLITL